MKASRRYVIRSSVRIPTKGLAIGDSIVADHTGSNSITHYLFTNGDYAAGYDVVNQAVSGNTIQQQHDVFTGDANKATYDWVIIQVGVNNLSGDIGNPTSGIIQAYQNLVNYIKTNGKAGVKVIASTMTPCKQRLDEISYSYDKWLSLNQAIRGEGSTPITGTDGVCSVHTDLLNDGSGNLAAEYEGVLNDHIHPNNTAKELIALQSWKPRLQAMGLFTP